MPELTHETFLYAPALCELPREGWTIFVDGEAPNWAAVDERGAWLLREAGRGAARFSALVARYGARFGLDPGKAWVHTHAFLSDAIRQGIASITPSVRPPYAGRAKHLSLSRLRECWLHTNNSCNLTCRHCLVSSSPSGEPGLATAAWRELIDQAAALGVDRFYLTGGEPFVRADLPELIARITERHGIEAVVLTNATLLGGARAERLEPLDRSRAKFQVSLDGATAAANDPIRGRGSFAATVQGLAALTRLGFEVTLTTVVTRGNLADLEALTRLASSCGARGQHLMWMHRRGRATETADWFPRTEELVKAARAVKREADRCGVVLDNAASFELRANAPRGTKFDLGNAGWQSLCIYADGHVYPSAALANHRTLDCGDAAGGARLEAIWRTSPVLAAIREASVISKPELAEDPLRFLTGGGDVEHSFVFSGRFDGEDPYYPLSRALLLDAMDGLAARRLKLLNHRAGYDAPRLYHAMGEGAIVCGTSELGRDEREVAFLHSNCVLSFDVEKPRRIVRTFYGQAAEQPASELCCPTRYDPAEVGHIPQEVLDRFYGCGSPVAAAELKTGETYVDLGSGAGIDCFVAAKHVGPSGRVIGIDMTEEMLAVARANQGPVAARLGFDVVEFRHGVLERIPVEDKRADALTSNCVINLSPDKPAVFSEAWRILKDLGRAVIADIVSEREVPPRLKVNERLWGECIVGALTEEAFLRQLEEAGFYGLVVLKKTYWKMVEGYHFFSMTVRGYKMEKTAGCEFIGQFAIYRGPMQAVLDEEGHLFPRNVAVRICTDTARKLAAPPYVGSFAILEPESASREVPSAACCPGGDGGSYIELRKNQGRPAHYCCEAQ